ncbi:MAG: class I SAM-dependent methyltransferase [Deltaproteobacteria bacterium]
MSEKNQCPICKSPSIEDFLSRRGVPAHQHLICPNRRGAREAARGDLVLALCRDCGFIYNRAFDPSKIAYGGSYDNSQTYSAVFERYLSGLAMYLVADRGVRNSRILEVGCGKGWFLRRLVEFEGAGNEGYGFDPSYEGDEVSLGGRLRFERGFYDSRHADISADVVLCRHVIEHLPEPLALIQTIKQALVGSAGGARVFFETPSSEWILENRAFWDFFYEHCSYFSEGSLRGAFEISGFRVREIRPVFGGQYLWLEASLSDEPAPLGRGGGGGEVSALAAQIASSEKSLIDLLTQRLRRECEGGRKIAFWGAGAKGVTLANLIDPGGELIRCIVDLNPRKQGKFLPGSGHPIVACAELANYEVNAVILMNPNYFDEVLALVTEARQRVSVIDLADLINPGSRTRSPLPYPAPKIGDTA